MMKPTFLPSGVGNLVNLHLGKGVADDGSWPATMETASESDCSSDKMTSGRFQPTWLVLILHLIWTTRRDK